MPLQNAPKVLRWFPRPHCWSVIEVLHHLHRRKGTNLMDVSWDIPLDTSDICKSHTHTHRNEKKTKIINPEHPIVVATVLDLRFFSGPNFLESNPFPAARNGFDSPAVVSTLGEWIHHSKKAESFYEYLDSWWLNQPLWKICSSKWIHLPQIGMNI